MRISTQDDKDGLERRGEEETIYNSSLRLRTGQLESVWARPPSTGPGHHPGTTNFNATTATLDMMQSLFMHGCLRRRKVLCRRPHKDRCDSHTHTTCIPNDCLHERSSAKIHVSNPLGLQNGHHGDVADECYQMTNNGKESSGKFMTAQSDDD